MPCAYFPIKGDNNFLVGKWILVLRFHKWILIGTGQRTRRIKTKKYADLEMPCFQYKKKLFSLFLYCVYFLLYFVSEWVLHVPRFFFLPSVFITHQFVPPPTLRNCCVSVSRNVLKLRECSPNVSARTSPIQRVSFYNLVLLSIAIGYWKVSCFFEVLYFCFIP
jgi:hypothetical protein